jgi:hypothetical protein
VRRQRYAVFLDEKEYVRILTCASLSIDMVARMVDAAGSSPIICEAEDNVNITTRCYNIPIPPIDAAGNVGTVRSHVVQCDCCLHQKKDGDEIINR